MDKIEEIKKTRIKAFTNSKTLRNEESLYVSPYSDTENISLSVCDSKASWLHYVHVKFGQLLMQC